MERRRWQPTSVLLPGKSHGRRSLVGCRPWGHCQTQLSDFTFTFHFPALEKEMATHSSVLAWRISGTREPGGLPSMGSHRVGHNWSDLAISSYLGVLTKYVLETKTFFQFWRLKVQDQGASMGSLSGESPLLPDYWLVPSAWVLTLRY